MFFSVFLSSFLEYEFSSIIFFLKSVQITHPIIQSLFIYFLCIKISIRLKFHAVFFFFFKWGSFSFFSSSLFLFVTFFHFSSLSSSLLHTYTSNRIKEWFLSYTPLPLSKACLLPLFAVATCMQKNMYSHPTFHDIYVCMYESEHL